MLRNAWQTARSVSRQCAQALPLVWGGARAIRFALRRQPTQVVGGLHTTDVQKAQQDPWKVFIDPMEVAEHERLSAEQKAKILGSWEEDATHLAVAEGEGMGGGEPNRLSDITEAKKVISLDKPAPSSERLKKQG